MTFPGKKCKVWAWLVWLKYQKALWGSLSEFLSGNATLTTLGCHKGFFVSGGIVQIELSEDQAEAVLSAIEEMKFLVSRGVDSGWYTPNEIFEKGRRATHLEAAHLEIFGHLVSEACNWDGIE